MSRRMPFIIDWNTAGALVRPNSITRYSNCPHPPDVEGGLSLIPLTNLDKMVGVPQVQFGKDLGSMEGTKSRVEEA